MSDPDRSFAELRDLHARRWKAIQRGQTFARWVGPLWWGLIALVVAIFAVSTLIGGAAGAMVSAVILVGPALILLLWGLSLLDTN